MTAITTSQELNTEDRRKQESARRGWTVVMAAFTVLFALTGSTYSFSAFFADLQEHFQASRGAVSQIFAIVLCVFHLVGAVSGPLADRWGPRGPALFGAAAVGAGFIFASLSTVLWQLYLAFGVIGIGIGFAYVPSLAAVQRWFIQRRGFASGIAVSGIGVGTLIMPLAATLFITWFGWRGAFVTLGLFAFVLGGIAALFVYGAPERYGMLPDGGTSNSNEVARPSEGATLAEAVRSRTFWLLYVAIFLVAAAQFIPFVHLVVYAEDQGISHGTAVLIFGMVGIGSTFGRLVLGRFADQYGRRRSLAVLYLGVTLTLVWWLGATTTWQLVVFALVFGTCYGGLVALTPSVIVDYFGSRNASGIIGVLYLALAMATLIGPRLAGDAFDFFHNYHLPIALSAVASLLAAAIVVFLPEPQVRKSTQIAEKQ
jgi:MFS family permease